MKPEIETVNYMFFNSVSKTRGMISVEYFDK